MKYDLKSFNFYYVQNNVNAIKGVIKKKKVQIIKTWHATIKKKEEKI